MLSSNGGARLPCIVWKTTRNRFQKLNKIQTVSAGKVNARVPRIKIRIRVAVTGIEIDYFL